MKKCSILVRNVFRTLFFQVKDDKKNSYVKIKYGSSKEIPSHILSNNSRIHKSFIKICCDFRFPNKLLSTQPIEPFIVEQNLILVQPQVFHGIPCLIDIWAIIYKFCQIQPKLYKIILYCNLVVKFLKQENNLT